MVAAAEHHEMVDMVMPPLDLSTSPSPTSTVGQR